MNKFLSNVIIATFASVCSFGVVAGSHDDKNKETMRKDSENKNKQESDKYKSGSTSTSNKDSEMREKSLSERKSESSEQEVMNKKPYKQ